MREVDEKEAVRVRGAAATIGEVFKAEVVHAVLENKDG
jgi:hypothetical protein